MAYCTAADVQADFAQLKITLSTTTTPTLAQVEGWIDDIAGEMDAVMKTSGVLLPVTTNGFLKNLNVYGVAARVMAALKLGGQEQNDTARDYRAKMYRDGLDDIRKNPRISGGSLLVSDGSEIARSDWTSSFTNTRSAFTRDGADW